MLTEFEVERSFRRMFGTADIDPKDFDRGEELIDQLRPESPLRLRLSNELDEIRKLHKVKK